MSDGDYGGDPPCWAHLFDDDTNHDTAGDAESAPAASTETNRGPTRMATSTPHSDQSISDAAMAALVHNLADAVIVCDPDGSITYWNDASERVFGWTAAQARGQSLDLIIPDKQRNAHWDGYARVMATGVTKYGADLLRVPSLHADGERRSIAFTVSLLRNAAGEVTGIAAVVRDETERWAEERELRRQLREATQT